MLIVTIATQRAHRAAKPLTSPVGREAHFTLVPGDKSQQFEGLQSHLHLLRKPEPIHTSNVQTAPRKGKDVGQEPGSP